jgi:hypothetical protein
MPEELQRLRDVRGLMRLLVHYAQLGREDRQVWQDRLTGLDGVEGKELTRLYGELLAYGWLEQNTGVTPVLVPGRLACCYRISTAGLRALKRALTEQDEEQEVMGHG